MTSHMLFVVEAEPT